jgi:hypothetical protein
MLARAGTIAVVAARARAGQGWCGPIVPGPFVQLYSHKRCAHREGRQLRRCASRALMQSGEMRKEMIEKDGYDDNCVVGKA